ncbi:MAG: periplasmic protein TonB, links inner and outer rane [Bacteroidetes bacterium]|nr:periplasmic protein TonB, links inner and outer rane [Bacteroidota bacterium]
MDASAENRSKYAALGFTLGFHALLFLLFILVVIITPLPPFKVELPPIPIDVINEGGIEGMGKDAGGSGNKQDDIKTTPEAISPAPAVSSPNIVTDESATDVSVKKNPKAKPEAKNEDVKTPEEEKASSELLATLAKIKSKRKHDGEGEGTGQTGGSGTGTGTGIGSGKDDDQGNGGVKDGTGGHGWDLIGRSLIHKPERLTDATEEGIVVVEIVVDENGKVIDAIPGQRGSTTFSQKLYAKARLAAKQAKFNPSPNGVKEQHGTYTFVFTLE